VLTRIVWRVWRVIRRRCSRSRRKEAAGKCRSESGSEWSGHWLGNARSEYCLGEIGVEKRA